ncbi:hypothetical protein [Cryptosporangium aurantiacum]|uniref:Uncharacterized protein n=1 Tax=Cryptosporangium aurantiacum TaxID=134849 RepID=A0A1M7PU95_9ACTN|nr:hypothetical protein [Cryptosporangium aurantiacum]SHN21098.1 hypothetical protein SAMN05443668_103703 [Cryptosporangium aurantiacum]
MSRPQSTYPHQAGRRPGGAASSYPSDRYETFDSDDRDPPGRYPGGGSGGPGAPRRSRRGIVIATVAAAVVGGSVLGLAGAEWYSSRNSEPVAAPERSLPEIAEKIGCKPTDLHKNSEFQQAACVTGGKRMTILTFVSNQKMYDWIKEAEGYGGAYLVGTKWLVTSTKAETLDPLVDDLGGQIMLDSHY